MVSNIGRWILLCALWSAIPSVTQAATSWGTCGRDYTSCKSTYWLNGVFPNRICSSCPSNASCAGGSTSFSCEAGYYKNKNGTECTKCSPGEYQDQTGQSSCKKCPSNATSCTNTGFLCKDTMYPNGNNCSPCPNHASCTGGSTSFSCKAGYYKNGTECTECPKDKYQNQPGQSNCQICPAGNYLTNNDENQNSPWTLCEPCASGQYQDQPGQTQCISCPSNTTYCISTGFSCKAGYYKDGTTCAPCPTGTYNDKIGQTNENACTPCHVPDNVYAKEWKYSDPTSPYTSAADCKILIKSCYTRGAGCQLGQTEVTYDIKDDSASQDHGCKGAYGQACSDKYYPMDRLVPKNIYQTSRI